MINRNRNNGVSENEILQNEFTAFITTSLERERIKYLKKSTLRNGSIYIMSDNDLDLIPDETDFSLDLCEYDALAQALKFLDERERYVLFARVLEEKSFEEIADKLGLKYKGVAAIYYRTTAKLRNILGGM